MLQLVTYAQKRTILDPESAPENMSKLVHHMYNVGLLRIECFAYKRVGFDEELNAGLVQHGTWAKDRKAPDTGSAAGSINSSSVPKQEQKGQRKSEGKRGARGNEAKKKGGEQTK